MATKNQLRGHSKLEINMKIESLDFRKDSSISDNGRVYYSGNDYYGENEEPQIAYATLEKNYWLLDGNKKLLPENNFALQPLISEVMSDSNGVFAINPTITISAEASGLEYNLIGLKFVFDTIDNDYPIEFDVECYLNNTLIRTITWENSEVECDMTDGIDNVDMIKIVFKKMNKPNRRLRLTKMFLGLHQQYTNKDIIEASHKWTIDLLSREITDINFKFTVDNRTARYNADNPNSINRYFQEQQLLEIKYYYEISGNVYELVNGGKLYLTGTPKAEKYEATFEAKGELYFMSDVYKKGIYSTTPKTYTELLTSIFNEMGISNYTIDSSLEDIKTNIPLPMLSAKELIQLICNATNMVCIEDREGYIHIKAKDNLLKGYYLDLDNQIEFPIVETQPNLKDVNVAYYQVKVESESEEIFNGKFNIEGNKKLQIEYSNSPATECVATVTNGTIVTANYYAYYCELDITVTDSSKEVSVVINGKPIELNKSTYTLNVNLIGENCDIDNPLIDSEARATDVAHHFKNYLINRNIYTSENRGEPAWDSGDVIKLETQFSEEINAAITSNEIVFDGALSGKTTFRNVGV